MTETVISAHNNKISLVAICGPTASGKTALAIECAGRFGGDILSADSMQIYRYMDIGTAKPTEQERRMARHHLLDLVDPDETFSASRYADCASAIIEDLHARGTTVFVAGGTGLYIDALLGGLIEGPSADAELRQYYHGLAGEQGTGYIHDILKERDSRAAGTIHPNDAVRIIRALEVLHHTGTSIVDSRQRHGFPEGPYRCLKIGLTLERSRLFKTIDDRVDHMVERGLVRETEDLLNRGYDRSCGSMQAFCYRHIISGLAGEIVLDEALRRLKRDTRHYAKRQMTWFRRDTDIHWYEPGDERALLKRIEEFLSAGSG